jgi:hypothetical protein
MKNITMKRRIAGGLIFLFVGIAIYFGLRDPSANLSLKNPDEDVFQLKASGINSISSVSFWIDSPPEMIWQVNFPFGQGDPQKLQEIEFGRPPDFGEQIAPKVGAPRQLESGEELQVSIEYQYDEWLAPSGAEEFFSVRLDSEGRFQDVTRKAPSGAIRDSRVRAEAAD